MSGDNETQLSYLYIWKETILELVDPPSAMKLPLVSSLQVIPLLLIVSKKVVLWEVGRLLTNSKQVSHQFPWLPVGRE